MKKIVLIGAGQLGSRHLQGIAKIDFDAEVYVVDPFSESLRTAQERFEQVPDSKHVSKIEYMQKIEGIPEKIDLCIIASNSDVRFSIISELFNSKKIDNLVLEKFLFNKISDYKNAEKIFKKKNCKVWVNCPRRYFELYQELKKMISDEKSISIQLNGGDWGMGSNAIHFIDLFCFLTNSSIEKISSELLDEKPVESKRKGFFELTGTLTAVTKNNSMISLHSHRGSSSLHMISIVTGDRHFLIDESKGQMTVMCRHDNWTASVKNYSMLYQSGLTNILSKDILFTENCALTSFNESSKMHLALLNSLKKYFPADVSSDGQVFPLT